MKKRSMATTNGSIDLDVLDCTICMDPLQPPVYQCAVGHAICANCHGSRGLPSKDRCHKCSAAGGYNRCNAMEKVLDSVSVPCPNAAFGCAAATRYHDADAHRRSCPHAPCFCPEPGCGFTGSTAALLRHLTGDAHGWPATETTTTYGSDVRMQVQEGKTRVLHHGGGEGAPLFLVSFTPAPPFGTAVSVVCVDPHPAAAERKFRCRLSCARWKKTCEFQVGSTDLSSGGLPAAAEDGGCAFVLVPKASRNITVSIIAKSPKMKRANEFRPKRLRQTVLPFAIVNAIASSSSAMRSN